jgi:hypothetical protein
MSDEPPQAPDTDAQREIHDKLVAGVAKGLHRPKLGGNEPIACVSTDREAFDFVERKSPLEVPQPEWAKGVPQPVSAEVYAERDRLLGGVRSTQLRMVENQLDAHDRRLAAAEARARTLLTTLRSVRAMHEEIARLDPRDSARVEASAPGDSESPGVLWLAARVAAVEGRLATIARPPVEKYVRCSMQVGRYLLEPAVEYRSGDVYAQLLEELQCGTQLAVHFAPEVRDIMHAADLAGGRIAERWPDRAYYVEAWEDGDEGYAQVVQPFGFPRNEPPRERQEARSP